MRRGIRQRQLPRQGHHHSDRVLGRRDGIAERGVHDDNATLRRGVDINVINPDPGAAHDFQISARSSSLAVTVVAEP